MSWSSLNADDLVSFTNVQSSGILLRTGQSATTSNDIMTKDAATTKYILNPTPLASKSALDCVAKKDLVAGDAYTYSVKLSNDTMTICTEIPQDAYSDSASYTVGMYFYADSGLTAPLIGYDYIVGPDSVIRGISSANGLLSPNTFGNC